jgi:hypothetical protein
MFILFCLVLGGAIAHGACNIDAAVRSYVLTSNAWFRNPNNTNAGAQVQAMETSSRRSLTTVRNLLFGRSALSDSPKKAKRSTRRCSWAWGPGLTFNSPWTSWLSTVSASSFLYADMKWGIFCFWIFFVFVFCLVCSLLFCCFFCDRYCVF